MQARCGMGRRGTRVRVEKFRHVLLEETPGLRDDAAGSVLGGNGRGRGTLVQLARPVALVAALGALTRVDRLPTIAMLSRRVVDQQGLL